MKRSQQKLLGAIGVLRPNQKTEKQIREKYTNSYGEFQHRNPRGRRTEHIPLDEIQKIKNHKSKHILKGTSPNDGKPVTKIIYFDS